MNQPLSIQMKPETRQLLKMLASGTGEYMGDFLEMLLESQYARLDAIRKKHNTPSAIDGDVIRGLLALDAGRITEAEFKDFLANWKKFLKDPDFEFHSWGI